MLLEDRRWANALVFKNREKVGYANVNGDFNINSPLRILYGWCVTPRERRGDP